MEEKHGPFIVPPFYSTVRTLKCLQGIALSSFEILKLDKVVKGIHAVAFGISSAAVLLQKYV